MEENIQKRNIRNKSPTKPLKIKLGVLNRYFSILLDRR